jgi:hypothetical protein
MAYTILCILPDGNPAFPVSIPKTRMVGELKAAIKLELAPTLSAVLVTTISLYQVQIDASDMPRAIAEAATIFRNLSTSQNVKLNPATKLDKIFGPAGPSDEWIHILVSLPGRESLGPWMWCHC